MFSTLSRIKFVTLVTFILSSAKSFKLDLSKIWSFGKELNERSQQTFSQRKLTPCKMFRLFFPEINLVMLEIIICVTLYCPGVVKNQNFVTMASDMKGEIGYITSLNLQPRPQKVKATIANIPVATESLQKFSTLQCKSKYT